MKLAKKTLSVFLSLLMIFSVCSVGLTGITASAAAGDSKYTHAEVVAALNEVVAQGYSAKGSGNATNITGDNGKLLAAAEAVFDYAVKTYRGGRNADSANNSSDTLYNAFINEFSADFSNATALNTVKAFAKDIIYPAGTTVYGYPQTITNKTVTRTRSRSGLSYPSNPVGSVGSDVSGTSDVASFFNSSVKEVTKSVAITVDVNSYLQTFAKIEDIPASFLTSASYSYSHAIEKYAVVTGTNDRETGSWFSKKYYTDTYIDIGTWNYMSAKPVRTVEKNTTAKKYLLSIEKYFNEDIFALTQADLLAMSVSEIEKLYTESQGFYTMATENFTAATLAHFGMSLDKIEAFMTMLDFAYRVIIGKHSIDTLNQYIGTEYNKESYAEMSSLYTKVNSAYNIVDTIDTDVLNFILNEYDYSDEYSAIDLAEAKAYIDELYDIMTEQRLEELVASMTATYNDYYSLLDKENIERPTDAEVIGLVQKVDAYNSVLAQYPGYDYYRTYYTTEHEAAWNDFCAKLSEVAEVRGLKATFQTYYDFFMPIIFTTMIVDLSNDAAMDLYENIETNLTNLKNNYTDVKNQWGETIANKIFTINYEGTDYLLQDLIESVKSTGLAALKQNLIDRTVAQLDAVMVFKDVTVINFDNFADVKSTISHFDYDLYDYVNGKGWLTSTQTSKYAMVQTLLDRYHAFSTTDGKAFFDEDFTFADENGNFTIRYAGSQFDSNGSQIGYPTDIARGGAEDNYVVNEQIMVDTVARIDNFIVSRDFGALVNFVDVETEEPTDLKTYINQMLSDMLYTDELINTLVAAIFPMICDLIETELVGAIGGMDGAWVDDNGIPWLNLQELTGSIGGNLALYLDNSYAPSHDGGNQKDFPTVFKELGLYIYPSTLAESLSVSNPSYYGKDSEIYKALTAAGRDWSKLVVEDDPDTIDVDETKTLEFAWGVYDEDSFLDTIACILDSILPILQAVFTNGGFSEEVSNAAIAYSPELLTVDDVFIRGGLRLTIDPLNAYSTLIVPLFEVLGVEKIPALNAGCSGDDITRAVFGTLLDRVDEILSAPLSSILDILPNLVYFLSMDSVQEIIDGLNIKLNLNIHEVEVIDYDSSNWLVGGLLDGIDGALAEKIAFDIELKIADLLDLYDLLGFEITNFNEVLAFAMDALGLGITLPPIKQQEIIFCSDWGYNAAGRVDLEANKGDLMYWFLDYVVSAIADGTLLDALLGDTEMDPTVQGILQKVVTQIAGNPNGALAAIVELLNPVTYDLEDMDWLESTWNYDGIEGANQMSIVYLNYGNNDWTREKAEYLVENINPLIDAILEMTGTEMEDLGVLLQDTVNGLFTNENITALVKMLGGLGDSASAVITDVIKNQVGINLDSWFIAFGYLFPEGTWKEDAEIIMPDTRNYVNNFGVEGVANEDGTISWFFNRMPLVDGDGYTFINILSRLLGEASILIEFLFAGEDISAFETLVTVKGYETYDTSIGLVLEMLGVQNLPTQADFNESAMGSFTNMLMATLDWFYALTSSDDMIKQIIEMLPNLFYFIESNGLSTLLHNLLMPVLVLVDTVRPIFDVDINGLLSYIVSDFLNYGALDMDGLIQLLVHGVNVHFSDLDYVWYSVDVNNLKVSEIIKILDTYMGTNLYESGLVEVGIKGYCSGIEKVENTAVGTVYKSTVDAADTVTILVTALLDCLSYPAADGTTTNGDALFGFIAEATENEKIADLYPAIASVIAGVDVEYTEPNWGYMFTSSDLFSTTLPEHTIVYLGYATDWTPDTAETVDAALNSIVEMVLDGVAEGNTIAQLLNGVLEDNVYTDANLTAIVELIVNAIAALDVTLRDLIDVVITTDIAAWFAMCDETVDDEGKTVYVCNKDWGVDEAAEADKKDIFVEGLKEVLEPANGLLAWLFFGEEYAFFTGSETDAEGNYVYNDIIKLNGGEGYARGLVPVLEALGCTMQPASAYYDTAAGTYNVGNAVEGILNSVLALVDEISGDPATGAFDLLANVIYFANADGIKSSVNNLLAPVDGLIEKLSPVISEDGSTVSIGGLLEPTLGFNISDITMDTLLGLAVNAGFEMSEGMVEILTNFYIGELTAYTSANGLPAYRMTYTDEESQADMLTIVLSFALEAFTLNEELFSDLLGAETYTAVLEIMAGAASNFTYVDPDWAYMYDGEDALDKLLAENLPAQQSIVYLAYTNDWNNVSAQGLSDNLGELVDAVISMLGEDEGLLGDLINSAVADNLYKDEILDGILEAVVKLLADLDYTIVESVGALLGADVDTWFDYCTITRDADGKVTDVVCNKDWGIDTADDKATAFAAAFTTALEPANRVLSWLLFGEDYEFFTDSTKEVIITLTGGEGYAFGLVPILEALGCTMKAPAAYATADGYAANVALGDVIMALCDKIDVLCSGTSGETVDEVIAMLPNLLYFISADGVNASVNNLLAPVMHILNVLEPVTGKVDLVELIGFDIFNIGWDMLFGLLADELGVVLTADTTALLKNFYIGEVAVGTSANGRQNFYMSCNDAEAERDMITLILSVALDTFTLEANKAVFEDLIGAETFNAILTLLAGAQGDFTYADPDWAYMYDGEDALAQLAANNLPARTEENSIVYTQYTNNWNKATADYLDDILYDLIKGITESARDDGKSVGILLDDAITNGLYKNSILNSLLEAVIGLLADLDYVLVDSVGALLDIDVETWFSYCTITRDADGKVTDVVCTKDWGIDAQTTNEAKREAFVKAFVTALEPANRLLAWLFFGEDYAFFNNATGDIITIKGGNGYAEGLVPLLEALGCTMGADTDSGIRTPESFYVDGELDMSAAVGEVFGALADWLNEICGDMNTGSIDVMLEKLPNFVYFVNAGGLKSVVNNLLQPVNFILEALEPMGVEVDFSTLVKQIDITNVDFYAIFGLVEDLVELYFPADVQKFVAEFYMGEVVEFTSANGKQAFRMQYTEAESRAEMITILISLVLDAAQDPRNEGKLSDWLGEDIYWSIMNVLRIEKCKDMEDFDWILTEYANTGKQFSAIETSTRYSVYNEYWTKDKAQYMADNFNPLVSNVLCLLGLEINGTVTHDIYDLLDVVISDNLYTQEMADTMLNAIKDLLANLTELEPYGEYIVDVLNTAFGIDLSVYDNMTVTITEGTREEFEAALVQMLTPVVPLLEVILCGKNISLFYELDGDETIVIFGSEGYAYGIIPLFEALGCEMPTPEEYKAAVESNPEEAIRYLTTPLLDRVDAILADPIGGILEILPAAMYFINSNGLETAFTNLVAAVDTVLVGLEPVVGARSLEELLDIDLSEFDAEYIIDMLVDMLNESTDMDFSSLAVNLVSELTFGEVVDYVSANGETYYTMNSDGVDNADMVTAVLRMAIDFITTEENLEKIKVLLADAVTDEDAYNSICSILDTLAEYAAEDPGMSMAMSFIFAVFEAATEAIEKTDDAYHDVNNSWQFILKLLSTSEEPLLRDFADNLKGTLNKYFDGIFDEEGLAPDGAMTFFDKIKAFFEKIAEFFRKLFGMA